MLWAACKTLASFSPAKDDPTQPLLPDVADAPKISSSIALAVAKQAIKEGVAGIADDADIEKAIREQMWRPVYLPYKPIKKD